MLKKWVVVVDSGIGGLNVLKKLQQSMPQLDYVYFADEAHCPYGEKSAELLRGRIEKILRCFANVSACNVVACNTASVCLTDELKLRFAPLVDVIQPMVEQIVGSNVCKVAVLGTKLTVASRVYQCALAKNGVEAVALDCGEFVRLAEEGAGKSERLTAAKQALSTLPADVDCVALCCTHFDYFLDEISQVVGQDAVYVSSAQSLADSCVQRLEAMCADNFAERRKVGKMLYLSSKNDNVCEISRQTGLPFQSLEL